MPYWSGGFCALSNVSGRKVLCPLGRLGVSWGVSAVSVQLILRLLLQVVPCRILQNSYHVVCGMAVLEICLLNNLIFCYF